ncbi:DUF1003 domain-containing protein [Anaerospora sp.]|uniref:DUF1003 domain-containing protein n=1 Tax=Anaerospora sp. TaxID=1960278 RepID=UPI0028A2B12F|nr:DUF1003 domain-containing protein [Anaerospora sp.]
MKRVMKMGNGKKSTLKYVSDEGALEGFDIQIDEDNRKRIDKLVDNYERTIITRVNETYLLNTSRADQLADTIARFGGSWKFIILFLSFLILWMVWNILQFTYHFDEAPFILLNLILSCLAALQAPIIMMSQNRQATRDKDESIIDFAINYKAEQEIDDMQGHLHRLEKHIKEIHLSLKALDLKIQQLKEKE